MFCLKEKVVVLTMHQFITYDLHSERQGSNSDHENEAEDDTVQDLESASNEVMGDNVCILVTFLHFLFIFLFLQLIIQDITTSSSSSTPKINKGGKSLKALLSEFENRKLALFAKRCVRAATCLVTMCPEDPLFGWPIFTEEVEGLVKEGRCPDFVASLKQINNDPECRDKLVRFVSGTAIFRPCVYSNLISLYEMNYGCCAVRLDLGKEIRIRTVQFYNIPGTHSSPEIVGSSSC